MSDVAEPKPEPEHPVFGLFYCPVFSCHMTAGGCKRQRDMAARVQTLFQTQRARRVVDLGLELERAIRCYGCWRNEDPDACDLTPVVIAAIRAELEELERRYHAAEPRVLTEEEMEDKRERHRAATRKWRDKTRNEVTDEPDQEE